MAANIGYLFYREYYKDYFHSKPYAQQNGETEEAFKRRQKAYFKLANDRVINASKDIVKSDLEPLGTDRDLRFLTTYPGMLIGSGYSFGTGMKEGNEFKLGFYFDHTTGMPMLPGSSVKGLLRSVFPDFSDDEVKREFNTEHIYYTDLNSLGEKQKKERKEQQEALMLKKEKALFTWWMVYQEEKWTLSEGEYKMLYDLEQAIFESKEKGKAIPIYDRDIFHDAYIIASHHSDGRVLGSDFITPHKHTGRPRKPELDQFSNPVPVMFMKVLPNVEFQFCFDLKSHGIPADAKKALFKRVIEIVGAGAKTNVGYGVLTNPLAGSNSLSASQPEEESGAALEAPQQSAFPQIPVGSEPADFKGRAKKGTQLQAKCKGDIDVYIIINGEKCSVKLTRAISFLSPGDIIIVTITEMGKGGVITKVSFEKKLSQ